MLISFIDIRHVQEIDIDCDHTGLIESDSDCIGFSDSILQLQSGVSGLAAASNESVNFYKWTDRGELVLACTQSFSQERIKFFTLNPIGREILLLHSKSSQVTVSDGEFKYFQICFMYSNSDFSRRSVQTRAEFSTCAFVNSSSVVALAGDNPWIDLVDLRGVFTGLRIADTKSPFSSVNYLTPHQSDSHLLAASCKFDVNGLETRIYDIRYPKESSLNIFVTDPHCMLHFGNFSSSSSLLGITA